MLCEEQGPLAGATLGQGFHHHAVHPVPEQEGVGGARPVVGVDALHDG
jgi:hypothetical protein